ncbi:translation protein SH3-like domain-containing protein [Ochromonadaceae sp. CCMP2298]|nr:translation protein SH3-like domain-containing protein [Ochromonadaceae sp. CCMP2298]|mmetsp:Transcript_18709/g.41642  ORF Transcript_18709/g.41642 Transcript_18709/m.41642 type:complete len:158 (-) Transcript_18709:1321-1794(-)
MLRFFRPETVARCARSITTEVLQGVRQKHKVPQKKASKLLDLLKNEEFTRLKAGRNFPEVRAGDSVVIEKLPYVSATEPDIIKGLVIAKTNRASDTALRIWNVEYGTPVFRRLIMYSPLIKSIKILQKAFIHKGQKRVRRSKLYYLKDRHPDSYTVK